jgi:glucose/arabinose dehydrogenase
MIKTYPNSSTTVTAASMRCKWPVMLLAALVCTAIQSALGAWQYPDCPEVTDADFRLDTIVHKLRDDMTLHEMIEMVFDMDDEGNVDIYFSENMGHLRYYNARENSLTTLGTIPVGSCNGCEDGFIGLTLDPNFKENRWIYVQYDTQEGNGHHISRFTLDATDKHIMLESEVILFSYNTRGGGHPGGSLVFDAYGDLWGGVGESHYIPGQPGDAGYTTTHPDDWTKSLEWGPSNTAAFPGSIFRIHPESDGSYTIPEGNFGEYFADYYEAQGDPATEEHNMLVAPGFYGWPYFAGPNFSWDGDKDPLAPTNTSQFNDGLEVLPPAIPGTYNYDRDLSACSITGPIYRYDGALASDIKLPPHFNRIWFVSDYMRGTIYAIELDETGEEVLRFEPIFQNFTDYPRPLDLEVGPDGALYVINHASIYQHGRSDHTTGIYRIAYTGDCHPEEPRPETIGCMDPGYEEYDPYAVVQIEGSCVTARTGVVPRHLSDQVKVANSTLTVSIMQEYTIRFLDINGREVRMVSGSGPGVYPFSGLGANGVYFAVLETEEWKSIIKLTHINK